MALAQFPAVARAVEARLAIINNTPDEHFSEASRRGSYPIPMREMWACSMAFAPMSRADAELVAAFCEQHDGRVTSFKHALGFGVFRPTVQPGVTLSANAARGANTLSVNVPTGGFPAGTLINIGDIETSRFQLLEVLAAVGAGAQTIAIAPRLRFAFNAGTGMASNAVFGKWQLARDDVGRPVVDVSSGAMSVEFIEATA